MFCIISLPRASSVAIHSWILESLSIKYPEYKQYADNLLNTTPEIFQKSIEIFEYKAGVENILHRENSVYEQISPYVLYEQIIDTTPLPIINLKVGKSYNIINKFIKNQRYKTITLLRRDLRQQFLSFILSMYTKTFHGDPHIIHQKRQMMSGIYVSEDMFTMWFEWLRRLHRIKQLTDYVFYIEDYVNDPEKLLKCLDLPELDNYSKVVQKTIDNNLVAKITNIDEFNKNWNKYCSIYKDVI